MFEVQGVWVPVYNRELVTGAAQQAMRDIAATNAIAISIVPPIQRADLALFGANDFAFV